MFNRSHIVVVVSIHFVYVCLCVWIKCGYGTNRQTTGSTNTDTCIVLHIHTDNTKKTTIIIIIHT